MLDIVQVLETEKNNKNGIILYNFYKEFSSFQYWIECIVQLLNYNMFPRLIALNHWFMCNSYKQKKSLPLTLLSRKRFRWNTIEKVVMAWHVFHVILVKVNPPFICPCFRCISRTLVQRTSWMGTHVWSWVLSGPSSCASRSRRLK